MRPATSPRGRRALARFLAHRPATVSAVALALIAAAVLAEPLFRLWLGPEADAIDLFGRYEPPSAAHPLGRDELGRDVLLRLVQGGRVSLTVGLTAAVIAAAIGTAIGLVAGWCRGWTDAVLMRLTDTVLVLPVLPLLIVLAALDPARLGLGEGEAGALARIVLIVALVGWTTTARLARGATLAAAARDYVRAGRALGASGPRLVLRHVLPNIAAPVVVAATLAAGNVILFESVLSFLGLGLPPSTPSWGNMLTGAQETIWEAPMLAVWPGLLIFVTVMAFNFVGDGLQQALDPRSDGGM